MSSRKNLWLYALNNFLSGSAARFFHNLTYFSLHYFYYITSLAKVLWRKFTGETSLAKLPPGNFSVPYFMAFFRIPITPLIKVALVRTLTTGLTVLFLVLL